ncbi:uncharacterized protein LOC111605274 [Drosophila hydei]|uniref:Uncharacterized protein LOC111605274 n=1 Tax=Drosophila hydei TaxID=7224 RepID=A0A6J1MK00_DROHY|nr:uncharacterized protein LOC111605274 [Drosophila hydei]
MAAKSWYGSAEIVGQHEAKGPCPQLSNGNGDKLPAVLLLKKYPQYYKTKQQANDITKALINHERKCFMIPYTKKTNSFNPLSTPRLTNQLPLVRKHNASYKHSVRLDPNTFVGRVFPMMFRLRREQCKCLNCRRALALRETVTDVEDVLLLSDCCTVVVYPNRKLENWNRVTVGTITGQKTLSKKQLTETCQLEPKSIAQPVPEEQKIMLTRNSTKKIKKSKKSKKPKKPKKRKSKKIKKIKKIKKVK